MPALSFASAVCGPNLHKGYTESLFGQIEDIEIVTIPLLAALRSYVLSSVW
jgi:hypothetical protein